MSEEQERERYYEELRAIDHEEEEQAARDLEARADAYEQKVLDRLDRLRARATKKAAESAGAREGAMRMAEHIPLGQPILVGHHSEKRDRRYRERIRAGFERSFRLAEEAREMARRADAAESNTAISSDDPRAIDKLRAKLAEVEAENAERMRVNKLWRKGGRDACIAAGIDPVLVAKGARNLELMPSWRAPFLSDSANARRIKERIAELERSAVAPAREPMVIGDVRIEEDKDDNRVRVTFPRRPGKEATTVMRRWGFVWSHTASAWQRKATFNAWVAAEQAARELTR